MTPVPAPVAGDSWTPHVPEHPELVRLVVISECAAPDPADNYGASSGSLFDETTLEAFAAAGLDVASVVELRERGVHLTVALRYPKPEGRVTADRIADAAPILDAELATLTGAHTCLLAGDVAIATVNRIARNRYGTRAVPAGPTYRIRGGDYHLGDVRLFPSYLQAGPAWFIEASKRRMIAEDLAAALAVAGIASPRDA